MNPKVDFYFNKAGKWQEEVKKLRNIILSISTQNGLTEELKWGKPCYTLQNSNVFLIHDFKEYCAILFMKGALLKDAKGLLVQQTENVQSARQLRFTSLPQIVKMESTIKAYIKDAVKVEKTGLKVTLKKTTEFNMPEEFKNRLNKSPALKKAFEALTPGRQRGYLLYFSSAKQSATRESRIEKYTPQIMKGKGLDD